MVAFIVPRMFQCHKIESCHVISPVPEFHNQTLLWGILLAWNCRTEHPGWAPPPHEQAVLLLMEKQVLFSQEAMQMNR